MQGPSSTASRAIRSSTTALAKLERENADLRREVEELRGLREVAYRDPLTGLRNRRFFDERLGEELARHGRHPSSVGALLVLDVDEFKSINDSMGHAAGDRALKELGQLIESTLRLEDVCCRTGGDEFMVILPQTGSEGARQAVRRVRSAVLRRNLKAQPHLDMSIGMATWPTQGREAGALMAAADHAMYEDKARARRFGRLGAGRLWLV